MADTHSSGSPLDAVVETVGERSVQAFELLGNETRLAILLAFWEAKNPGPPAADPADPVLSFSELYDRIDIRDSGNFTYHLDKLVGTFIEEIDEGYTLTTRAERILSAVLAGTLVEGASFEGEPIDPACYECGGSVILDYRDGILTRRCTSCGGKFQNPDGPPGTLANKYLPPVGLEYRTPQEFFRKGNTWHRNRFMSLEEGVCPDCSGPVTATAYVCEAHDTADGAVCERCGTVYETHWYFVCDVCKFGEGMSGWAPIFTDTAVKSFFYEHGLDHDALYDRGSPKIHGEAIKEVAVNAEDPLELRVTVELDGDRLHVTLDDDARVIDVTEEG